MLTSTRNPVIQQIRKLQSQSRFRKEQGAFVIEGIRLVRECLAASLPVKMLLHTGQADSDILTRARAVGAELVPVNDVVMKAVSDTKNPQNVLAVLPFPGLNIPENLDFVLLLDTLRDPGNMGTILRAAHGAGVEAVFLTEGCADPFSPKVVRAGMGAHFYVPVRRLSWRQIEKQLRDLTIYLADAAGPQAYTEADLTARLAFVIGSEAHGVSAEAEKLSPVKLRIPMPGGSESLNAAMAAGILMYETVRQRN